MASHRELLGDDFQLLVSVAAFLLMVVITAALLLGGGVLVRFALARVAPSVRTMNPRREREGDGPAWKETAVDYIRAREQAREDEEMGAALTKKKGKGRGMRRGN